MTYGKKEKLKIILKNMLKMNKIIFVKVTGFHNIFNVSNNTYNISELKSSVTNANKNSIIFITADSTDEDYGYMTGSTYIWTHGELYSCNDYIIPLKSKEGSSSIVMKPYIMYNLGTVDSAINISLESNNGIYCKEYMFRFIAGPNCVINLPNTVKFNGGVVPTFIVGRTYEYNIVDDLAVVGEFF